MALYDNTSYLKCPACNNREMKIETRGIIEDRSDVLYFNKHTAIICSSCNEIVKKIDKYNPIPIVEV